MTWQERFDEQFPRFKDRAFTEDTADVIKLFISQLLSEVIDELESNPHPGTEFKNLQYWIEAKQLQLKDKYGV